MHPFARYVSPYNYGNPNTKMYWLRQKKTFKKSWSWFSLLSRIESRADLFATEAWVQRPWKLSYKMLSKILPVRSFLLWQQSSRIWQIPHTIATFSFDFHLCFEKLCFANSVAYNWQTSQVLKYFESKKEILSVVWPNLNQSSTQKGSKVI